MRARGYAAKPASDAIPPADFIPLSRLTTMLTYPEHTKEVPVFYNESEKLVRFLNAENKQQFLALVDALSKGANFDSALWRSFGGRFTSVDALEQELKNYASKDYSGKK